MLRTSLLISGAVSVVAIVAAAVVVLSAGSGQGTAATGSGEARARDALLKDAAPADPAAKGVIVLNSEGNRYWYEPDGKTHGTLAGQASRQGVSADGNWLALIGCGDDTCSLHIWPADGGGPLTAEETVVPLQAGFDDGRWANQAGVFAALDVEGRAYFVDPETREARVVKECCVTALAWTAADDLLVAGQGTGTQPWLASRGLGAAGFDGTVSLEAPVTRLYASPDRESFAFAQAHEDGWRLVSFDTIGGELTDYGRIAPNPEPSAFSIAWSRREDYLAVSPVDNSFLLVVFDTATGERLRQHAFAEGYAGELKWSPADDVLAISTYSPDRTRHEVYILEMAAGTAPRHILPGCRIVWSPDGEFLALKAEPHSAGAAVARADTGAHWQLSPLDGITPIAWGVDRDAAVEMALQPADSAAVLGK